MNGNAEEVCLIWSPNGQWSINGPVLPHIYFLHHLPRIQMVIEEMRVGKKRFNYLRLQRKSILGTSIYRRRMHFCLLVCLVKEFTNICGESRRWIDHRQGAIIFLSLNMLGGAKYKYRGEGDLVARHRPFPSFCHPLALPIYICCFSFEGWC